MSDAPVTVERVSELENNILLRSAEPGNIPISHHEARDLLTALRDYRRLREMSLESARKIVEPFRDSFGWHGRMIGFTTRPMTAEQLDAISLLMKAGELP